MICLCCILQALVGAQAPAQTCLDHSSTLCTGLTMAFVALGCSLALPLWRTRRSWSSTLRHWGAAGTHHLLEGAPRDRRTREVVQLVCGGVQREVRTRTAAAQQQNADALANLAPQVAHAVRSPLAALEALTEPTSTEPLPEESRAVVRVAASRIEAIAADLMERAAPSAPANSSAASTALCATQLLEETLRALRQKRRDGGPTPYADFADSAHGAFVAVARPRLAALLHALITEVLEAVPAADRLMVHASASAEQRTVIIGMAAVDRMRGLEGLQRMAGDVGGTLTMGSGNVALRLPILPPPAWYVPQLRLPTGLRVVVADDDPSMHAAWRARLRAIPHLFLHHVNTPDGLRTWYSQHGDTHTLFLVDHDFRGHSVHGFALIDELRLAPCSVLVTSHGDDPDLQARCAAISLPLLNKSRLHSVPIHAVEFAETARIRSLHNPGSLPNPQ